MLNTTKFEYGGRDLGWSEFQNRKGEEPFSIGGKLETSNIKPKLTKWGGEEFFLSHRKPVPSFYRQV